MPHPQNNSWGQRLAALDAASVRLASKTASLNSLLEQLHVAAEPVRAAASAGTPITPPRPSAALAPVTPVTISPAFVSASSGSHVSATTSAHLKQIQSLQSWLTSLALTLEHGEGPRASSASSPLSPSSSSSSTPLALGALTSMFQLMSSAPLPGSGAAASSNTSPARRSTLVTIQPLNSGGTQSLSSMVPKGLAFVNGRWIKMQSSPRPPQSHDGSMSVESEEEPDSPDPFAEISDHDDVPSPPKNYHAGSSNLDDDDEGQLAQGNPLLEESPLDIDEDDAAGLVLGRGRAASAAVDEAEDEDDPFGDIPDLDVDPAEEEYRRKDELARASKQKAASRLARNASKTATLRKPLAKHMHQDTHDDFDDADVEKAIEAKMHHVAGVNANVKAQPQLIKPTPKPVPEQHQDDDEDDPANVQLDFDDEVGLEDELSPAGDAARRFTPSLPKSAPGVHALTTRREGQQIPEENWPDVEVRAVHLRKASAKLDVVRPDDLDGMSDGDEDQAADLQQRHQQDEEDEEDGFDQEPDEEEDMRTPEHSVSARSALASSSVASPSSCSRHSVHSYHGQLRGALSDDDALDDLDDMMDEDEDDHASRPVIKNVQADVNRATLELHEFALGPLTPVFQASEVHRREFLGSSVALDRLAVLKRPVNAEWMLELAKRYPPVDGLPLASSSSSATPPQKSASSSSSATPPQKSAAASASPSSKSKPKKSSKR